MPTLAEPFAVARLASKLLRAATILLITACGPTVLTEDTTSTSASSGPATAASAAPTSTTTAITTGAPATSDTGGTGSTEQSFIPDPDGGNTHVKCDPFSQDCPEGEKCVPWDQDGYPWTGTKCTPITGNGAPGDPCTAPEGGLAGIDDCGLGALCWAVDKDGHGTCVPQCLGDDDGDPLCPEAFSCEIAAEGLLALCVLWCHPLPDDCPEGARCLPEPDGFGCAGFGTQEVAPLNGACSQWNGCEDGLFCLEGPATSNACAPNIGCCQPFCTLPDGACPNPDQQCRPWFEVGEAPAGYEQLGFCGVPG